MKRIALITAMIAAAAATPAMARSMPGTEMVSGAAIEAPFGYSEMCSSDPRFCKELATPEATVVLSEKQRMKLLRTINRRVNARVHQQADLVELWRRPGMGKLATGDCEDLAIEKRMQLISAGFPPRDLFFAVGYLTGVGLHAVLVAHTAKGDIVLDSRTPWATLWTKTPYIWLQRQSDKDPSVWVSTFSTQDGAVA